MSGFRYRQDQKTFTNELECQVLERTRELEQKNSDLEKMKLVAMAYAKAQHCNYNIIILNPNGNGEFDLSDGSTYEFVKDSYFETERPNVVLLHKTDDLLKLKISK